MVVKRVVSSKIICFRLLILTGSIFLSGVIAIAQNQSSAPEIAYSPLSPDDQLNALANLAIPDKDFIHGVYQDGMAEVQLSQLAIKKSSSSDVIALSKKMMDDRTDLDNQMEWAAQHMKLRLPSEVSKKDKELISRLQGMSGAQFDDAYIVAMIKDNKNDAQDFQTEGRRTQNPNLQQLTHQGSQVIAQQKQMIEQVAESHNLMTPKGKLTSADR